MSTNVALCHGKFGRAALLQMQCPLVVHAHSEAHLLFNLNPIPVSFLVRGERLTMDARRFIAVNPWEPHSYPHQEIEDPLILAVYVDPARLESLKPGWRFGENERALDPGILRLVNAIQTEILYGYGADAFFVSELVDELLLLALDRPEPFARSAAGPSIADYRIRRSIDYMRRDVGGRAGMATIASVSGLSREHFFVRFRDETGLTPSVYWNMLKMEHALEGLATTEEPVCQIAYDLGFSAPGNFTRFFIQHQGVAPLEYRRASRRVAFEPLGLGQAA